MEVVKEIKRQGEPPKGRLVADLDKLISEPTYFKLHGKTFEMKPVSTQNYFVIADSLAEIWSSTKDGSVIEYEESIDMYVKFFASCIPDLTREDIENMTQAQVSALAQQVVEHAKGTVQAKDDESKKKENLT